MASQVLRRLTKTQLAQALHRLTAAPFHVIMWDNKPVRLTEALGRLEQAPDDACYYATSNQVYTIERR